MDEKLRGQLIEAFVAGAKWWEFESTKGTMWASDRKKAYEEAEKRYQLGIDMPPKPW